MKKNMCRIAIMAIFALTLLAGSALADPLPYIKGDLQLGWTMTLLDFNSDAVGKDFSSAYKILFPTAANGKAYVDATADKLDKNGDPSDYYAGGIYDTPSTSVLFPDFDYENPDARPELWYRLYNDGPSPITEISSDTVSTTYKVEPYDLLAKQAAACSGGFLSMGYMCDADEKLVLYLGDVSNGTDDGTKFSLYLSEIESITLTLYANGNINFDMSLYGYVTADGFADTWSQWSFSASNSGLAGDTFKAGVTISGIPDEEPPNETPEPGTLVLLGTGILGAAIAARRKIKK